MELPEGSKIQLLAPVVRGRKGMHEKLLAQMKRSGYVRVLIDGSMYGQRNFPLTRIKNILFPLLLTVWL